MWNMTTLNILVEAAKLVEYDDDIYAKRKKLPCDEGGRSRFAKPVFRRGTRETHNILEKNRRAEMKNYFQNLKGNLPKLRDMVKASNVSILTDAVNHIQELTATDKQHQSEMACLRKCQLDLEERIKVLKEDIRRQHFCAQLFVQVQEEKKRAQEIALPIMMSVEVQANESDIQAELPPDDNTILTKNNRNCLSDLRNDFSQNVQSSTERLSSLTSSKGSPAKANFTGIENSPKPVQPLERLAYYSGEVIEIERGNAKVSKYISVGIAPKKIKLALENEDTDSDNELRIIIEDE